MRIPSGCRQRCADPRLRLSTSPGQDAPPRPPCQPARRLPMSPGVLLCVVASRSREGEHRGLPWASIRAPAPWSSPSGAPPNDLPGVRTVPCSFADRALPSAPRCCPLRIRCGCQPPSRHRRLLRPSLRTRRPREAPRRSWAPGARLHPVSSLLASTISVLPSRSTSTGTGCSLSVPDAWRVSVRSPVPSVPSMAVIDG